MKLEDQVCSLDLAKRLEELGVKSLFFWNVGHWDEPRLITPSFMGSTGILPSGENVSAFTVAELGEMLPKGICSGRKFSEDRWECFPIFDAATTEEELAHQIRFQKLPYDLEAKEADARAKMLIYLIEKGLIKP